MSGNQWEVVGGKPSKKLKPSSKLPQKTDKKNILDRMPKIDVAPPLQESQTIYDAFIEKTPAVPVKPSTSNAKVTGTVKDQNANKANDSKKAASLQKKKTSAPESGKEKPGSLEEVIQGIDRSFLEAVLAKSQSMFPDNPDVWLKDMASVFTLRLEKLPEPDILYESKPKDYPLCLVPSNIQTLLRNVLSQASLEVTEHFLMYCVQSMIEDLKKDMSTFGHRIFIQLVSHYRPEIGSRNLDKYVELLKSNQNHSLRCLMIMWAVGQAGYSSFPNGLKVWLEVMLPVLNKRSLSTFAVNYLENLLRRSDFSAGYDVITLQQFFSILEIVFEQLGNLSSGLQKQLVTLYPKMKLLAFGDNPSNKMKNFFPSFLAMWSPKYSPAFRAEILACLVMCLETDKHCFSLWRQMYVKHLAHSSILLKHLSSEWEIVRLMVARKLLFETVQAFSITNEELLQDKGHAHGEALADCVKACKELLTKMNTTRFPWRLLLFLTFLSIVTLVSYDVYVHGNFKKSKTHQWLSDVGVLVFLEQAWNRIVFYTSTAFAWLWVNVPLYCGKAAAFVAPYLNLFWSSLYELCVYIVTVTRPARDWLNTKIPEFLDWTSAQIPWLLEYFWFLWAHIVDGVLFVWRHVVYWWSVVSSWLLKNVFIDSWSPDNIWNGLIAVFTVVQSYTSALMHWCINMIYNLTDKKEQT